MAFSNSAVDGAFFFLSFFLSWSFELFFLPFLGSARAAKALLVAKLMWLSSKRPRVLVTIPGPDAERQQQDQAEFVSSLLAL